ncbi:MAG TPA: (2Fe-2S)-binding protein [Acidimicrobiia bacterium]|jgi:bacterioferritin-associated ferredoxin|nr:(2Fe-2S)-binding protein [Acidimicrobiia bacterium]
MVICSCRAVTDRAVIGAIVEGATTVEEVADRCAAASRCGGCSPALERLLAEHLAARGREPVGAAA